MTDTSSSSSEDVSSDSPDIHAAWALLSSVRWHEELAGLVFVVRC